MKRTISFLLGFCLLISLLILPASAATISTVELVDVNFPSVGSKPDYEISVPDNCGYYIDDTVNGEGYINGIMWTRYMNGTSAGKNDTIVADTYLLKVCLQPDAGYSFASSVSGFPLYGVVPEVVTSEGGLTSGCLILTYWFDNTTAPQVELKIMTTNGGYSNAGTVTGAGTYAAGSTVTVSAKPSMGFTLVNWSGEGDNVLSTQHKYTFVINEDTTLYANFGKAPFDDICGTDYYYSSVCWAVDEGITAGVTPTTFAPKAYCTRAQVVAFLHRSAGSPWPHSPVSPFTDVTGGEYYYDAVMWAVGSGITAGTTASTFSPNAPCTRAQVVSFLWRANGCPEPTTNSNPFTDVAVGAYYYDAVLWAVERGVTAGTSATTFSPNATCTRAQVVSFLHRFIKNAAGSGAEDDTPAPEIVYQYPSYMEFPGELAKFWVVVGGGTEPYTYEWQYTCDGMDGYASLLDIEWATGANTDTLTFYVDTYDYEFHYFYRCKITDSKGKTIYSEPVYIIEPLRIVAHPNDVYCNVDDVVKFHVEVSGGTEPYTYQWQYTYGDDMNWFDFNGDEEWAANYFTDTMTLYVSEYDFDFNYRYRCIITDAYGAEVTSFEAYPLEAMG